MYTISASSKYIFYIYETIEYVDYIISILLSTKAVIDDMGENTAELFKLQNILLYA